MQTKTILNSDSEDEAVSERPKLISESESEGEPENKRESEEEPENKRPKKILDSDSEDDDDDDDEEEPKKTKESDSEEETEREKAKKIMGSDSEDDDDEEEPKTKTKGSDSEEGDKEDDDDDGHEDDEEVEKDEPRKAQESDSDDDEANNSRRGNDTIYDFDIMMAKKKEENSRKRRRRNYDIINDNDDIISDIINQMKDAVEADNEANRSKTAATNKLKLLQFVINQLRKVDLRDAFLDSDVLSVMSEWLAPLPDKSLPHLKIREELLKILLDFNLYDIDRIRTSGIGKSLMYLYKHPKETRENKQRAKQLISCWSRPIFQLESSFGAISREEREQRDLELRNKQRRASRVQDVDDSDDSDSGPGPSSASKKAKEEPPAPQKPGDKGWIPRARVPAPSMRDYVIRPRSKVDGDIGKSSKRPANMLEKLIRTQQERRRASKQQRAVNMKIDRV